MSPTDIPVPTLRLTMGDIAAACGVDRSTVTRWRQSRKSPAFPSPMARDQGSGEAELFGAGDVHAWLSTAKPNEGITLEHLHPHAFARELLCRHSSEPLLTILSRLLELEPARRATETAESHRWLLRHMEQLPEQAILDRVLDFRPGLVTSWPASEPLRSEILALMAGLVDAGEGKVVVHDPAAGEGDLLVAVIREMAERTFTELQLIVTAEEENPHRRLLLKRRLNAAVGRNDQLNLTIGVTDAHTPLPGPVERLAALLPLNGDPQSTVSELDRLLKRVVRGGQLVVVGPREGLVGDLAFDSELGRRRAKLLRANGLEVLVDLAGAVRGPSDRAAAVLVLRRWQETGEAVVVDLRQETLTAERVAATVADIRDRTVRARIQVTAREDLLASDFRLALPRVEPSSAPDALLETLGRVNDLQDCVDQLARLRQSAAARPAVRIPIGKRRRGPDADLAVLTPGRDEETTSPGDVVVAFSDGTLTGARVDHAGGAPVRKPDQIVRITEEGRRHWTPRVLAALIAWRIGWGASGSLNSVSITPPPADQLLDWERALEALENYRRCLDERMRALAALEAATTRHLFSGQGVPFWGSATRLRGEVAPAEGRSS